MSKRILDMNVDGYKSKDRPRKVWIDNVKEDNKCMKRVCMYRDEDVCRFYVGTRRGVNLLRHNRLYENLHARV